MCYLLLWCLLKGGFHILRWALLHSRNCCHGYGDHHSHHALLPICQYELTSYNDLTILTHNRKWKEHLCMSEVWDLVYTFTRQVPWLHMLYAAIGAIVYTLVSSHSHLAGCSGSHGDSSITLTSVKLAPWYEKILFRIPPSGRHLLLWGFLW